MGILKLKLSLKNVVSTGNSPENIAVKCNSPENVVITDDSPVVWTYISRGNVFNYK